MIIKYTIVLVFGILTRIILGFTNYIQSLGLQLSESKNGSGFQNAMTPPLFLILSKVIYGLSLITIFSGFFETSFITGFKYMGIYLFALITVGALFFRPGVLSPFAKAFYRIVLHSMENRCAKYKKDNDEIRAEAIRVVIDKFKEAYK